MVRATRKRLDRMPVVPVALETDAANVQEPPSRRPSEARISEFTIESDLSGPRLWLVEVMAPPRLIKYPMSRSGEVE